MYEHKKTSKREPTDIIAESDISVRCLNAIRSLKFFEATAFVCWTDFIPYTAADLLRLDHIGLKTLQEIREQLALRNLKLKGE